VRLYTCAVFVCAKGINFCLLLRMLVRMHVRGLGRFLRLCVRMGVPGSLKRTYVQATTDKSSTPMARKHRQLSKTFLKTCVTDNLPAAEVPVCA
jgi:hypothetical protein